MVASREDMPRTPSVASVRLEEGEEGGPEAAVEGHIAPEPATPQGAEAPARVMEGASSGETGLELEHGGELGPRAAAEITPAAGGQAAAADSSEAAAAWLDLLVLGGMSAGGTAGAALDAIAV